MRRCLWILVLGITAAVPAASGQGNQADMKQALAGVTDRGRALYDYDQCAWHGTDAIFALHPDANGLTHYICTHTDTGWKLVFPRWNESRTRLLVAYEATETGAGKYTARKVDPAQDAGPELTAMERAMELSMMDFGHPSRPYNAAILPAPGGNVYVYMYPGQTEESVWPLGGDVRYMVSADGMKILEKRQMHKEILDTKFDAAKKPVSGFHTHVLSDVPEDTDVFYVLNRRPLIPEYVGTTGGWVFVINTDGSIGSVPPCTKGNPLPCKKGQGAAH